MSEIVNKTWATGEKQNVHAQEHKDILPVEEQLTMIDELLERTKEYHRECAEAYTYFRNTDLASIITRIEQNIAQLKKIKYSLTD